MDPALCYYLYYDPVTKIATISSVPFTQAGELIVKHLGKLPDNINFFVDASLRHHNIDATGVTIRIPGSNN